MRYWLVRAQWGDDNKITQFIQNDEWINGYDDKYLDIVNRVQEEDILLLADNSLIIYYGVCVANERDGKHIVVDNWIKFKRPINFPAKGAYIKTIVKINDEELIDKVETALKILNELKSIVIKSIDLKNFTIFEKCSLEFSSGINIIIGENSTGKTQLLKLIYSLIQGNNIFPLKFPNKFGEIKLLFKSIIESIFKPNYIKNLITKNRSIVEVYLDLGKYNINFNIQDNEQVEFKIEKNDLNEIYEKKSLFLPAKEMLSFYTGFRSIYDQTSFDKTFDDLANHLGRLVPKNQYSDSLGGNILKELENILGGKIILDNDKFYLLEKDGSKKEINLIAEGVRKLGTIFHLIANRTIEKDSILFWDEPESNLNPRFIRYIAKTVLELEKMGVQVFIATHSLFLIKELEILNNKKESKVKYFSFGFDEEHSLRISQENDFDYLKDLIILDEELEQDDRFMMELE